MDFIEISAKTVDEAITKACIEMETSSDNLDIQIVSEGSSGFLGIGSKPAVIKATRKTPNIVELQEEPVKKTSDRKEKPNKREFVEVANLKKDSEEPKKAREERHREPPVIRTDEEIAEVRAQAQDFLEEIFKVMEIPVEIVMDYDNKGGNLSIDLTGEEMGILIGKRGQTLDSIQYLISLIVNKNREGYIRVKLDTENYRNRRKDTLESLARNIAHKVRKSRRAVSLEPMNPYERRIIHSSLQGNKFVSTYSEGNEPNRYVVVTLRK